MSENQHIKEALDYYLAGNRPTHHALMLSGAWGSGKTYFIKDYIKDINSLSPHEAAKKNINSKCFYISLYGLQTLEELQKQLFIAFYPPRGKTAKTLTNIDTISVNLPFLNFSFKPKDIGKDLAKTAANLKKHSLVFDDLERCHIPIKSLFGFINQLVEHNGQKVILIANEEKIPDNNYAEIKEKLVGTSLEMQTSPDSVLEHFIKELEEGAAKDCAEQNRTTIGRIFNELKIHNYRSLRMALYDFSRLLKLIANIFPPFMEDTDNAREARRQLLILVLVTALLSRANEISLDTADEKSQRKISDNIRKLTGSFFPLIDYTRLAIFFKTGIAKREDILLQLKNHALFYQPSDGEKLEWPAFQEALFWCLDEEEFLRLQQRFQHEMDNHYIRKIKDIFNLACTFIIWTQKQGGKLPFIESDIGTYFSAYITELANRNELIFEEHNFFVNDTLHTYQLKLDDKLKKIIDTYQEVKNNKEREDFIKNISRCLNNEESFSSSEISDNNRQAYFIKNCTPEGIADALFVLNGNIGHSGLYNFLHSYNRNLSSPAEYEWFAALKEALKKLAKEKQPPFRGTAEHIIEQLFSHRH